MKRNFEISKINSWILDCQVITPFRSLVLCADTRREMEEWIAALKAAASKEYYDVSCQFIHFSFESCLVHD